MAFGTRFEVAAGDATLAAERWAGPPPGVILLHAGVCDRRAWYAVADRLEDAAHLVAYDRRGHGGTPPTPSGFRHLDDLLGVLDAAAMDRVVVVGNSAGGGLALDLALEAPDRVAALLLLAPNVSGAPEFDLVDPATLVLGDRIDRAYDDGDLDQVCRLETWLWLDGPGEAEGRVSGGPRRLAEEMSRQVAVHDLPEGAGASGLDTWDRLEQVTAPAVVAVGDRDVPVIVDRAQRVAQRLPQARYVELEGMAHLPSLEAPDEVASLVREVLDVAAQVR